MAILEAFLGMWDREDIGQKVVGPLAQVLGAALGALGVEVAEAIDNETLREKCKTGLLYFSSAGPALQKDLAWDFDGDYFQAIENEELLLGLEAEPKRLRPQSLLSSGCWPSRTNRRAVSRCFGGHRCSEKRIGARRAGGTSRGGAAVV